MFRTTIRADENTDVASAVERLRSDASHAGVPPSELGLMVSGIQDTLVALVEQGRRMAGTGSQTNAERVMAGQGYEVRLVFSAGVRRSPLRRFLDSILGR